MDARRTMRMEHLAQSVAAVARTDVATLPQNLSVQQALDTIREGGLGEKIVYFYIVDEAERLAGVLPTRRLLTAKLDMKLVDLMIPSVVSIKHDATVMEACDTFVRHKFLAFPVVDDDGRVIGVVDIGLLGDEAAVVGDPTKADALFESIGFRVSQVRDASPIRAFRFRFPWLLATIASGTICAMLASTFEATLAKSIVLAFFLTLVLGLGESVSIQSMTVTIQALRSTRPTLRWYLRAFRREMGTALLLGLACGVTVGLIVWVWRGAAMTGFAVGTSIVLALGTACLFGLSIPALLHALRLDPKIAAGPVTLALADIFTLLFYFGVATVIL